MAMVVVSKRGSSRTTLRSIAEAIGISHGTITHYFPSLEALLLEVIARHDRDNEKVVTALGSSTLSEYLQVGAQQNIARGGLIALYTTMLATSIEPEQELVRDFYRARFERGRRQIAEALRETPDAGRALEGADPELLGSLIMAAFDGLQVQWLLDDSVDLPAALRLLDPLIGDAPGISPEPQPDPESPETAP